MDIEKGTEKLTHIDNFLSILKTLLKKHWGLIILLLLGYFFYWALTTDLEEPIVEPKIEQNPMKNINGIDELYIVKEYYDEDSVLVSVWSDGIESVE